MKLLRNTNYTDWLGQWGSRPFCEAGREAAPRQTAQLPNSGGGPLLSWGANRQCPLHSN